MSSTPGETNYYLFEGIWVWFRHSSAWLNLTCCMNSTLNILLVISTCLAEFTNSSFVSFVKFCIGALPENYSTTHHYENKSAQDNVIHTYKILITKNFERFKFQTTFCSKLKKSVNFCVQNIAPIWSPMHVDRLSLHFVCIIYLAKSLKTIDL